MPGPVSFHACEVLNTTAIDAPGVKDSRNQMAITDFGRRTIVRPLDSLARLRWLYLDDATKPLPPADVSARVSLSPAARLNNGWLLAGDGGSYQFCLRQRVKT